MTKTSITLMEVKFKKGRQTLNSSTRDVFKQRKDGKCLHQVKSPAAGQGEWPLSLELHERHGSVCSLWPLRILPWEFKSSVAAKKGRKHTHRQGSPGIVQRRMSWDCWKNRHCPLPRFLSSTLLHHPNKMLALRWH